MEEDKNREIKKVVEKYVLKMGKVPLNFIHARSNHNTNRPKFQVNHMSMGEIKVYCSRNGFNGSRKFEKLDFKTGPYRQTL